MDIPLLLLSSFIIAVTGLFFFIWSLRKGLLDPDAAGAKVIFSSGEIGRVEEPAATAATQRALQRTMTRSPGEPDAGELQARLAADASSARPAFVLLGFAVFWLLVASL